MYVAVPVIVIARLGSPAIAAGVTWNVAEPERFTLLRLGEESDTNTSAGSS